MPLLSLDRQREGREPSPPASKIEDGGAEPSPPASKIEDGGEGSPVGLGIHVFLQGNLA